MANCTQCGAALSTDNQPCPACGAPASAGVVVAAPAPIAAAAPANSGTNAVKIVLIVVAIFVALGILAVAGFGFMAWRITRAVHVSGNGDQATFNTPMGSFSANSSKTYSAEELGTDLYPGAISGRGSMKMDLPTGSMVTAVFVTSDSKEQVVNFYKGKLGGEASVIDSENSAVITLPKGQQESIMVTVTANSSQDGGKTRIAIIHTKTNKPS